MERYEDKDREVLITAKEIILGENVSFGDNIQIDVSGIFSLGNRSRIGSNARIQGRNIIIGSDLWSSSRDFSGLVIGRGRKAYPDANLTIGDRCTVHNSLIDLTREVVIGDDVGLSPEVTVYTHGYWSSVLEGFPAKFAGVKIGSGVIVGYRSTIFAGVTIGDRSVIGLGSVVVKDLLQGPAVYAGNPARFIRNIIPLSKEEKVVTVSRILEEYCSLAKFRGVFYSLSLNYPLLRFNGCTFDLEQLVCSGCEDNSTDDLRDFLFKYGLRFYTKRPFKVFEKK